MKDIFQLSIFDVQDPDEMYIDKYIGSGNKKYEQYYRQNGMKGFAEYMKKCEGTNGMSVHKGEFLDYDPSGATITILSANRAFHRIKLTWNEVAKRRAMYIESGEYNKREVRI